MANGTRRGVDLFRMLGVQVALDYSWFVVFLLVAWSLGAGYFPQAYPGHGVGELRARSASGATLLFFASVLTHELSHAAVANWLGDEVRRITLFIFGGMAELSREPREPPSGARDRRRRGRSRASLAGAPSDRLPPRRLGGSPVARGCCRDLAYVNLALGLFNLLPRVPSRRRPLAARVFWQRSGNLRVDPAGRGLGGRIAGGLMFLGVTQMFFGGLVGGLWLILHRHVPARRRARRVPARWSWRQLLDRYRVDEMMVTELVRSIPTRRWPMRSRTTSCVTGMRGSRWRRSAGRGARVARGRARLPTRSSAACVT